MLVADNSSVVSILLTHVVKIALVKGRQEIGTGVKMVSGYSMCSFPSLEQTSTRWSSNPKSLLISHFKSPRDSNSLLYFRRPQAGEE